MQKYENGTVKEDEERRKMRMREKRSRMNGLRKNMRLRRERMRMKNREGI